MSKELDIDKWAILAVKQERAILSEGIERPDIQTFRSLTKGHIHIKECWNQTDNSGNEKESGEWWGI